MESTRDLLATVVGQFAAAGVPTPEVDAELLLAHVTGRPRALLRMTGSTVTDEQSTAFAALVAQRVQRIPLQHLTGLAPFRHLELHVGPGVFIPRPETELMVDHVLEFAAGRDSPDGSGSRPDSQCVPAGDSRPAAGGSLLVVDLCAGSAALALSIATELPGSQVFAVELAPAAVEWARRNVADHVAQVAAVSSSIVVLAADATRVAASGGSLEHLRGCVDVVVTNPPYVPEDAIPREPEVRDHDPGLALFGGPDGLEIVRPLAEQAALLLRPGGLLLVEHADVQGEDAGDSGVPAVLRAQHEPAPLEPAPLEPAPLEPAPLNPAPLNPAPLNPAPLNPAPVKPAPLEPAPPTRSRPATEPDPGAQPDARALSATGAHRAWQDVTDHLDLAGRPRHTSAIRATGRMAP